MILVAFGSHILKGKPMNEKTYLTKAEAAEVLSVSVATINRIVYSGVLPAAKVGGFVRIPAQAIEAMMKTHRLQTSKNSNPEGKEE